jgi:hypothetical protein
MEVTGAQLDNGLLHIDLVRPKIESRQRVIEIRGADGRGRDAAQSRTIDVEPKDVSA